MRRAAFALTVALVLLPAAQAGIERCQNPFGPVLPDAASVTAAELQAVKAEVQTFIKDSDAYQACLLATMRDPEEKMTDGQKASADRLIASNQREKEAIGAEYNALVRAVNARGGK
jgi:hypothetical protein